MTKQAIASVPSTVEGKMASQSRLSIDIILALVAMAGPLYVDIMPAIIATLRTEYGLSPEQAGFVAGANGYGAVVGALLALFLVPRFNWRLLLYGLLGLLIAADLTTMAAQSYSWLLGIRLIHGLAGGLLAGMSYALMSQRPDARRSFGVLFIFHFGFGGLGIVLSSLLTDTMHKGIVFGILAAFGLIAAALVPLLHGFRQPGTTVSKSSGGTAKWLTLPLQLKVLGIFLFQAANLGLGAFLIGIAVEYGQSRTFAGLVVGLGLTAGVPGSLLMILLSRKLGWRALAPALLIAGLTKLLVIVGTTPGSFAFGVAVIYMSMAVALPYVLAACSQGDEDGYGPMLGGFASKLGLACGPMIAGMMFSQGSAILVVASSGTIVVAAAFFMFSFWLPSKGSRGR